MAAAVAAAVVSTGPLVALVDETRCRCHVLCLPRRCCLDATSQQSAEEVEEEEEGRTEPVEAAAVATERLDLRPYDDL